MVFYHAPMRPVHDPLRRLRQLDLNLLLAFDALADAGGVTAAAQTLGLSQSAMSHTLGRLRVALGDPLLVRAGAKMALTPRAEALKGPVRDALLDLERAAFFEEGFEPGSSERTFRMRSPDLFDLLILPPLYRRLHERAPGVDLLVRPLGGPGLEAELSEGIIDLAVVPGRAVEPGRDKNQRAAAKGAARGPPPLLLAPRPPIRGRPRPRAVSIGGSFVGGPRWRWPGPRGPPARAAGPLS